MLTEAALTAAVPTLHPLVIRRAAQIVPRDDAEDVAQMVWMRIWRYRAVFRGECALSSWVYAVTTRTAIDHLRRGKSRKRRAMEVKIDLLMDVLPDHRPSPFERAKALEHGRRLARRMRTLSVAHRNVLRAVGIQGLTMAEASTALAVPLNTVKTRAQRARRALAAVHEPGARVRC